MKQAEILVVGSINRDMIFSNPDMSNLVGGVPAAYGAYSFANGGKGGNQACAAAKLGARVQLVGCIGDDDAGRAQLESYRKLGVGTDFLEQRGDTHTGFAVMLLLDEGRYHTANVRGGNDRIDPAFVERALDAQGFDFLIMQREMPVETIYRSYEAAAKRGVKVIFDPGPAGDMPLDRLRGIYMISPNEAETAALTGVTVRCEADALRAARILQDRCDARVVLLKLGAMGAYLYQNGEGRLFPAFPVKSIDTTGAGDTFTAALAVQLAGGAAMEDAVRFANAAGALCVSRSGGHASIPTLEETRAFLAEQNGR